VSLRALIFDCDGVLADTERDGHLPAFNSTFAHFGLPVEWSVEDYGQLLKIGGGKERMSTLFHGPLRGTIFDLPTELQSRSLKEWHEFKTNAYITLIESDAVPGRPGIRRLVQEAYDAGWLLAVASTSAHASVRAVLTHAVGKKLASRFRIFAGDDVKAKKPSPDIYQLALAELGTSPSQTMVIEDSGIGCEAALAAGLRVIVTVSTYTGSDEFTGASLVTSNLEDGAVSLATIEALMTGKN